MSASCEAVRAWLLEADLEELTEWVGSEAAVHMKSCEECSEAARRLVAGQAELSLALDRAAATVAAEADPADARKAASRAGGGRSLVSGRSARWIGTRWRVVVPLAAATIAAVTLWPGDGERPPPVEVAEVPTWDSSLPRLTGDSPLVRSNSHDRVAVLPTRNPDIKIIWFMD